MHDLFAGAGIEGGDRFVADDEVGLVDEAAGDGDALLLLAGGAVGAFAGFFDRGGTVERTGREGIGGGGEPGARAVVEGLENLVAGECGMDAQDVGADALVEGHHLATEGVGEEGRHGEETAREQAQEKRVGADGGERFAEHAVEQGGERHAVGLIFLLGGAELGDAADVQEAQAAEESLGVAGFLGAEVVGATAH